MSIDQSQENKLGLWTSTSLVIGNMVGAGVFLLPAALASFGSISLLGWVVSSIGALLLAKIFSRLSKLMPNADGGPYAYTRKGFGDFAGFIVAWGYWISCWCTNATIAVSFVSALSTFFPILAVNSLVAILTGLSAIWLLSWINTLAIKESGRLQLATTILKLIPLIIVALAGLFFIRWKNFLPFNISGGSDISAVTASATLTFFAFLGIECATIPAGNVKDPEKTIPRATMIGTVITTLIYILGTISIMGIIPAKILQHSGTPFADAAELIWGGNAKYWIAAGVAVAAFGALNGWILIQGQISYAIAKDKIFPAVFGKVNKNGMPALGIIIGSILVSCCMIMNFTKGLVEQFQLLALLTTLTVLVPYLFSVAAYFIFINREKNAGVRKKVQAVLLALPAFAFCVWAVIGSGKTVVLYGSILLLAGIPFYFWIVRKRPSSKKNRI
jgi:basic amino acid/polyamine antiporter, APA family